MNIMTNEQTLEIDSKSMGNPARFRPFDYLGARLATFVDTPTDLGAVALVVARRDGGRRETPERIWFSPENGTAGDAWERQRNPNPDAQITVMQANVAQLIANGQPLELFGDNLFLTIDLSERNLPIGSQVRAGGCTLQVTPQPHNGCKKFRARFGADALRFVNDPVTRHRNLRGIYMRVVEAGEIGPGDMAQVLLRGSHSK